MLYSCLHSLELSKCHWPHSLCFVVFAYLALFRELHLFYVFSYWNALFYMLLHKPTLYYLSEHSVHIHSMITFSVWWSGGEKGMFLLETDCSFQKHFSQNQFEWWEMLLCLTHTHTFSAWGLVVNVVFNKLDVTSKLVCRKMSHMWYVFSYKRLYY